MTDITREELRLSALLYAQNLSQIKGTVPSANSLVEDAKVIEDYLLGEEL